MCNENGNSQFKPNILLIITKRISIHLSHNDYHSLYYQFKAKGLLFSSLNYNKSWEKNCTIEGIEIIGCQKSMFASLL